GEARPPHPRAAGARGPDVVHRHRQGDGLVHLGRAAAGPPAGAARRDQELPGRAGLRRARSDGHRLRGHQALRPQPAGRRSRAAAAHRGDHLLLLRRRGAQLPAQGPGPDDEPPGVAAGADPRRRQGLHPHHHRALGAVRGPTADL
ncbi:MAG: putative AsnC-family transcriptional regulatory protein, partial [uncultured Friedmanniella sp.]